MVGASKRVYHGAVSTHSRPKAAGSFCQIRKDQIICFNTQPPEGGWMAGYYAQEDKAQFQHTAARRRLVHLIPNLCRPQNVSTHSRPKAAGYYSCGIFYFRDGFQHTAARRRLDTDYIPALHTTISFNTQPPEGGWGFVSKQERAFLVSTHSRPKAAGFIVISLIVGQEVSTHSRPKAAGTVWAIPHWSLPCFNTQPPEGGWDNSNGEPLLYITVSTHSRPKAAGAAIPPASAKLCLFQHTAARRRLVFQRWLFVCDIGFQHTAARRRLALKLAAFD